MSSMRIFQLGLRRAAAPNLTRFQPAGRNAQRRLVNTMVKESDESAILNKQRVARPVSPHLAIYQPQIPWVLSSFNRITGVALSGGLYLFGFAYLAAPALGWHLETTSMVAAVAGWPLAVKLAAKAAVAFPFFFHSLNGMRHLAWDLGLGFANKTVIKTGWTVVAATAIGSLYYTFLG